VEGIGGKKLIRWNGYSVVVAALVALLALAGADRAQATVYTLSSPDAAVVGEDQTVETVYEDTLYDLARKYSLGSEELIRVNPGVDPWLPGAGRKLVVPGRHILPPGPREGIVVNLPEHRLYYYPQTEARRTDRGHHLPGQHRQDGLAHAARNYPRDREAEKSHLVSAGIRSQGTRRGGRSAARIGAIGSGQSTRIICHAPGSGERHLFDPWNE